MAVEVVPHSCPPPPAPRCYAGARPRQGGPIHLPWVPVAPVGPGRQLACAGPDEVTGVDCRQTSPALEAYPEKWCACCRVRVKLLQCRGEYGVFLLILDCRQAAAQLLAEDVCRVLVHQGVWVQYPCLAASVDHLATCTDMSEPQPKTNAEDAQPQHQVARWQRAWQLPCL